MLSCADVDLKLDDYVDGESSEAERTELEQHLAECPACRELERGLRAVLTQAAALPGELEPARDLWPGIAARLGPPKLLPFAPHQRRPGVGTLLALAAAAAALVAILVPRASEVPAPEAADTRQAVAGAPGGSVRRAALDGSNSLGAAQAEYERATQQFLQALQAEGRTLPPATLEELQKNLATIDVALAQIGAAMDKDPQNAQLARLLNNTHRRRLTVLRQAVRLSRT